MNVLIVESPAKAKTLNKYLGKNYVVLASFGHIRDLPTRKDAVKPDQDFAMDWAADAQAEKRVKEIARVVKGADELLLATDPDREGEAIAWHVLEELRQRRVLDKVAVKRVTFNAVTKSAVLKALETPRTLNQELIEAYLARRALDYLVGFTLSPVLWRKLPGSRSAGRVQSVALRLVCEREAEIEVFVSREYWSASAQLSNAGGKPFQARLTHLDGDKLDKMGLRNEADAERARKAVEGGDFTVGVIERKKVRRNPSPPFTTSTLQQEAARKLHFSATRTMRVAQSLYEGTQINKETVGLITYMRTDSVSMVAEAVRDARTLVEQTWGGQFVPKQPRAYKSKQKNAQEAHEAIRPTNMFLSPQDARPALNADQAKLYEIIWQRAVASQMESAVFDQVGVDLNDQSGRTILRATGSVMVFEGFLAALSREARNGVEGGDGADVGDRILPPLSEGEAVTVVEALKEQHHTQPPPRYSEAGLVKKMEELGIGRPSTYASVLQILQDRHYARLEQRRFIPEDLGRVVTSFLEGFFKRYVEYTFTADLENQLDDISGGRLNWKQVLRVFWDDFTAAVDSAMELRIAQVLDFLNQDLGAHVFPALPDGSDPRLCPSCKEGRLSLKLSRMGMFVGCSGYPQCRYTRSLTGEATSVGVDDQIALGADAHTGLDVSLRKGPYGWYAQLGEQSDDAKPKRTGLPKDTDPHTVDLEGALKLLSLPRDLGMHPDDGKIIKAGLGRFGPYVLHAGKYVSLKQDDVLDVSLDRAVALLTAARNGGGESSGVELGRHPDGGGPIMLRDGRYGPYVENGGIRATLPNSEDKDTISVERAVELLKAKAEKSTKARTKTKKTASAAAKKATSTKPKASKKTAATKTKAKKTAATAPKNSVTSTKVAAKTTVS